jgi:epoxyqueuosine reductase
MDWFKDFSVIDFGYTEDSIPLTRDRYNQWVSEDGHGPLTYLSGERQEKRQDLKNHWSEFESAVVFLFSYHPVRNELNKLMKNNPSWNGLKIASYTLGFNGSDYHEDLLLKLQGIGEKLKIEQGNDLVYKVVLDTHPVLERDLALRAGLGWFGKNSMMINRNHGSFFIIGTLLLNKKLNLNKSTLETDHCGQCTKCIDACPTEAIDPVTRTIKAHDCISTFTIEQFKPETIPSDNMDLTSGFIFGCDICQDVCPWNGRIDRKGNLPPVIWSEKQKHILDFFMLTPVQNVHDQLEKMSGGEFRRLFEKTSFSRSGKRGLLKNLKLYLKQKLDILS